MMYKEPQFFDDGISDSHIIEEYMYKCHLAENQYYKTHKPRVSFKTLLTPKQTNDKKQKL